MRFSLLTMALGALVAVPAIALEQPTSTSEASPKSAAKSVEQSAAVPHASPAAHTGAAPAQQAQDHAVAQKQTARQDQATHGHSADPNYRWHNGRWWYWQNGGWLLWNGSHWLNQQERAERVYSSVPGRSFSYTEDGPGVVSNEAGIPQSTANDLPYPNRRIIGSFGVRGAGSKAEGRY